MERAAIGTGAHDVMDPTDSVKIAQAVLSACLEAAIDAYEDAGISGLCAEGRWECAIQAIQAVDLGAVLWEVPLSTRCASTDRHR